MSESTIERVAKWVRAEVRRAFRTSTPFLLCLLGGTALVALQEKGWIGPLLAAMFFLWALDLTASRAEAQAKAETAGAFVKALTNGEDTNITVVIDDRRNTILKGEGR